MSSSPNQPIALPGVDPSLRYLRRRSIFPIIPSDDVPFPAPPGGSPLDPANVQGDIYLRLPKVYQGFIFFIIKDVPAFRTALQSYKPTSSADVIHGLQKISAARESGTPDSAKLATTNIAFSRLGLDKLGVGKTGEPRFDTRPMRKDKDELGDLRQWDQVFDSMTIHGVIMVCTKDEASCEQNIEAIKTLFGTSAEIKLANILRGNVRPEPNKGKEHFGYMDGVSQPALRGLVVPMPGQLEADPGVLIMGYTGDPLLAQRPGWARDGSIMVFRKLEQNVKGWNDHLTKNARFWKDLTPVPDEVKPPFKNDEERGNFIGAALIGRWQSGAPIALAHFRDNPDLAVPTKANEFDYSLPGVNVPTRMYCPFNAHTRKTAPRNLDPFLNKKFLESSLINRAGIPYGKDYVEGEAPPVERGLLFVSYQSCLDGGFVRQQIRFSGNDFFPQTDLLPQYQSQDPITGYILPPTGITEPVDLKRNVDLSVSLAVTSKEDVKYIVSGYPNKVVDSADGFTPDFFVTSHGGEYFFIPSIPTLKAWSENQSA